MARRWIVTLVAIGVVALIGYGAVSWFFSEKLVAQQFTALGPVDFDEFALPEPETATIQGEGVSLAAWYFDNPRDEQCAVVCLPVSDFSPTPAFPRRAPATQVSD